MIKEIDSFLTPAFKNHDLEFEKTIVVMIDVLRASTTICTALHNGAKEIYPVDSTDKAVEIYSKLDRDMRFLGGERNCEKPSGFDAGNSPQEYSKEAVEGRNVILSTSNGTKLFTHAREAKQRIICSFVNYQAVVDYILKSQSADEDEKLIVLCAGNNHRLSYEDTLCAGALIEKITEETSAKLTDTAHVACSLYKLHQAEMIDFIKQRDHSKILIEKGYSEDIDIALAMDTYPVVPLVIDNSIKLAKD